MSAIKTPEITNEALKWIKENKDLKVFSENYRSPRVSSEFPDCSMPLTFDSLSRCGLGCLYCCGLGTKIYGPHFGHDHQSGVRELKDVEEGDVVYTYNELTNELEQTFVTSVMQRTADSYYEIDTDDGNTIKITGEHPVYVKDKGWTPVSDVAVGDEILDLATYGTPKQLEADATYVPYYKSVKGHSVRRVLEDNGIDFITNMKFKHKQSGGGTFIAHFYLPKHKYALFELNMNDICKEAWEAADACVRVLEEYGIKATIIDTLTQEADVIAILKRHEVL